MKRVTLERLEKLTESAKSVSDKLQDGEDENIKIEKVATLIKQVNAFLKANFGETHSHLDELADINFKPRGIIYNPGHYRNDEAWLQGKKRLINLLDVVKHELMEPSTFKRQGVGNGLFWTIIGVLSAACFGLFGLGIFIGGHQVNRDYLETFEENKVLKDENRILKENLKTLRDSTMLITTLDKQSPNTKVVETKTEQPRTIIKNNSLKVGETFVDEKLGISLSISRIRNNNTGEGIVKYPDGFFTTETNPTKLLYLGQTWDFEIKEKNYRLILSKLDSNRQIFDARIIEIR